jgi:hypothetical protein
MAVPDDAPAPPRPAVGARDIMGLSLVAFGVFVVEIAAMRAVAQVTWPPFSFIALSAAMLGGGLAGTALAVRPGWAGAEHLAPLGALLVAGGAPVSVVVVLVGGLEPLRVGLQAGATTTFVGALALLALPFVGLALVLSSTLSRAPRAAHALYGADLAGAALGAFASPFVIDTFGTPGAAVVAGVFGAAATSLLAPRRFWVVAGIVAAVGVAASLPAARAILPRPTIDKRIGAAPAADVLLRLAEQGRLRSHDGIEGRVDVLPASPHPVALIDLGAAVARGPGPAGGDAAARDGASAAFIARDVRGGHVLVVGAGAGWEVARALQHGAHHVDAVEVSGPLLDAAASAALPASRALYADPRVTLVHDEARAFLEHADASSVARPRWRHIVAVHTITNAAVAANAMRLAEDFLLTRESLRTLIEHVDDDGVLYLTRPANQLPLLADLARDALVAAGVARDSHHADTHLAMLERDVDDPFFRGLLVSRPPLHLDTLIAPPAHRWTLPPATSGAPLPDDDRPFFHRAADDVDARADARLRIEGTRLAERAVVVVGVLASVVAAIVLLLPLALRRRQVPRPPDRPARAPASAPDVVVAALLGVGFLALELSLAQRLTLICGRPSVAFAAVVGGLLLGAGVAGLLVGRRAHPPGLSVVLAAGAIVALLSLPMPALLQTAGVLALPATARMAVVAVIAAIVGAPLGLCFPGLLAASAASAAAAPAVTTTSAPWLYAINATTGVGAAALHAAVAPALGLRGTTIVAAACYGAAAVVVMKSRRRRHHE